MPHKMVNQVKDSAPAKASNAEESTEMIYLKLKNRDLAKRLADMQKNNADINREREQLQEELFNEKLRANTYANRLQNCSSDCRTAITQMVALSETLRNIMETLAVNVIHNPPITATATTPTTMQKQKTKAVQPMVSGCTISKPTIKIKRISDEQLLQARLNGESRSVPTEGATRSVATEGASRSAPTEGDSRSAPTEGDSRSVPTEGDSRSVPTEGDSRSSPTEGASRNNDSSLVEENVLQPVVNIRRLPKRFNYDDLQQQMETEEEEGEQGDNTELVVEDSERFQENPQGLSTITEHTETGNSRTFLQQTIQDSPLIENSSVTPRFTSTPRETNEAASTSTSSSTTAPPTRRSLFVTKRAMKRSGSGSSSQNVSPRRSSRKFSPGSPRVVLQRLSNVAENNNVTVKTEKESPVKRARRNASKKVTSYKEPPLTRKMRREF